MVEEENEDGKEDGHCGPDSSTGPIIRPFPRTAHFARALSCDPLRSLVCSLAYFTHSLARGTVDDSMAICSVIFSILNHSEGEVAARVELLPLLVVHLLVRP